MILNLLTAQTVYSCIEIKVVKIVLRRLNFFIATQTEFVPFAPRLVAYVRERITVIFLVVPASG